MTRRGEPREKYEYVSANTNVLALLIEAVAQKPYAAALQELVWQPIGAEVDGLVAISDSGFVYGAGGLHARLRDIARFGQIYTQPSLSNVLSASTMHDIQNSGLELSPSQLAELTDSLGEDLPLRAGWQWDMIWSDGAMFKAGYSGQGLYVDPSRQLVVAWFGTGLDYDAISNEMLPVSRQIAQAIGSGQR
jgi:CubicO group peptidase (beta-lactamase class C family)